MESAGASVEQQQPLVAVVDQAEAASGDEANKSPQLLPLLPRPVLLRRAATTSLSHLHHHAHTAPLRLVRNRSSEMRSYHAPPPPLPRELARYRADSLPSEPRLSVCSTSGMVYESVVVVGHTLGTDRVVYYLLEVRSWDRPLEGYVVRRRYTDFKRFHEELSKHMPASAAQPRRSSYSGFGLCYASSLLCSPLVRGADSSYDMSNDSSSDVRSTLDPLWSPKRSSDVSDDSINDTISDGDNDAADSELKPPASRSPSPHIYNDDDDDIGSTRRPSLPESWTDALDESSLPAATDSALTTAAAATQPGETVYDRSRTLPLDGVKFTLANRAVLPAMPSCGVAALLTTQHALITSRVEQFNAILAAVLSDSAPAVATLLMNFIQEKPGGQVASYTSLSEYAAIEMPWQVERTARRRAMSMGRRPPTLSREVSSSSSISTTHSGSGGSGSGRSIGMPPPAAISAA